MQKQIIFIHGGNSFESYEEYLNDLKNSNPSIDWFAYRKKWIDNLHKKLSGEYQIFAPHMPNKQNADYEEWKIWFEKMIPFINNEVIMIGHSLGGIFLAKYLSENTYPKKIKKLILVAPPHSETPEIGSFKLGEDLSNISAQCKDIHLFQSTDDPVVPANEAQLYKKDLPEINLHIFEDRGHFNQESFPEIIKLIKAMD
ncbi:MAG: alpha/beta fold hydrolase [Candidatus Moraniibacteriota bacterium]